MYIMKEVKMLRYERVNIKDKKFLNKIHIAQIALGFSNPSNTLKHIVDEWYDKLSAEELALFKKAEQFITDVKQKELV